jgi:DNA-binding NarL/FixJ family response regulator
MIRVLIVEDSPLVASGFVATLSSAPEVSIEGQVARVDHAEAFVRANETALDVVVIDVRLEDGTAFDLLRRLAGLESSPAYLIVSSFDLAQYVDAALHLGASGYLLKTAPTAEVIAAVRTVAARGWAFDPELVRKASNAKWLRLTERERGVIEGVLSGRSNDEIARDLDISRKTVEAHISKLFLRFGVASRAELAARAEREQWLQRAVTERVRADHAT